MSLSAGMLFLCTLIALHQVRKVAFYWTFPVLLCGMAGMPYERISQSAASYMSSYNIQDVHFRWSWGSLCKGDVMAQTHKAFHQQESCYF